MKEIAIFINDEDLQAASLALRLATSCLALDSNSNEVQNLINKACLLAKSPLISGSSL